MSNNVAFQILADLDKLKKSENEGHWEIIPVSIGEAIYNEFMEKGSGHKYIRRVVTGKPSPKYQYFYKVTGGSGLGHEGEMKVGSKFMVGKGHFHIEKVSGNKVTVVHDETGDKKTLSKEALKDILHKEHAKHIESAKAKAKDIHERASKHGSEKQKQKAKEKVEKLESQFGEKEDKKVNPDVAKLKDFLKEYRRIGFFRVGLGKVMADTGMNIDRAKAAFDHLGYEIEPRNEDTKEIEGSVQGTVLIDASKKEKWKNKKDEKFESGRVKDFHGINNRFETAFKNLKEHNNPQIFNKSPKWKATTPPPGLPIRGNVDGKDFVFVIGEPAYRYDDNDKLKPQTESKMLVGFSVDRGTVQTFRSGNNFIGSIKGVLKGQLNKDFSTKEIEDMFNLKEKYPSGSNAIDYLGSKEDKKELKDTKSNESISESVPEPTQKQIEEGKQIVKDMKKLGVQWKRGHAIPTFTSKMSKENQEKADRLYAKISDSFIDFYMSDKNYKFKIKKSFTGLETMENYLEKAIYTGPRGGKYLDPQLKIPAGKEGQGKEKQKKEDEPKKKPDLKGVKESAVNAPVGSKVEFKYDEGTVGYTKVEKDKWKWSSGGLKGKTLKRFASSDDIGDFMAVLKYKGQDVKIQSPEEKKEEKTMSEEQGKGASRHEEIMRNMKVDEGVVHDAEKVAEHHKTTPEAIQQIWNRLKKQGVLKVKGNMIVRTSKGNINKSCDVSGFELGQSWQSTNQRAKEEGLFMEKATKCKDVVIGVGVASKKEESEEPIEKAKVWNQGMAVMSNQTDVDVDRLNKSETLNFGEIASLKPHLTFLHKAKTCKACGQKHSEALSKCVHCGATMAKSVIPKKSGIKIEKDTNPYFVPGNRVQDITIK